MERRGRSKSPSRKSGKSPSRSPKQLSKLFMESPNRNILSEINKYLGVEDDARMRQVSKNFFDKYGGSKASLKGKIQKLRNLEEEYENSGSPIKRLEIVRFIENNFTLNDMK